MCSVPQGTGLAKATSVCAFMVPGLALWMPSGYSWGALLLLVLALGSVHRWLPRSFHTVDTGTWLLGATILGIGLIWIVQSDPSLGAARWDRFSKLALSLPCLVYAVTYAPSVRSVVWGVAVGCWGAGLIAMWQVYGLGLPRANGHTNAIQFGNLALLLGALAAIFLLCLYQYLGRVLRLGLLLGIGLAAQASLLSLSRGGWLALVFLPVLAFPSLALVGWRSLKVAVRRHCVLGLSLLVLVSVPIVLNVPQLQTRMAALNAELAAYQQSGDASTSIGHRLEHWRLAWHMGLERPWLGWGDAGYSLRKHELVAAGQFDASTLEFDHAHNEMLDMFAKRGVAGLTALMALYLVPLALFWPGAGWRRRWQQHGLRTRVGAAAPALRLGGVAIVLMYVGFGWTQVFFAHNSGVMFYVFMLILFWAALRCLEKASVSTAGQRNRPGPVDVVDTVP
ncbi:hypothetical protein AAV94_01935 [Lampropedia cohaerens]|uniref:O-antigen ligase-related domain-containing protein n=1 Tax=Lampropedia cohaerens TaxID=1610491 RepID=A0A0U1Q350_9BURK|nr:hypothetical protein AAV94_01935 [Lampropedia cohaerens]